MDITFFVDSVVTFITAYTFKVLGVILLLVGGWIVARWAGSHLGKQLEKTRLDLTLVKFFSNITRWLVLLLTVLTALEVFGVTTTSFVAVIGAAGLAIGLAFQGTLSNFASGVMLLTFRPFKVGDAVVTAGQTGKIDEIDLFFTKMDTFDNRRIIIPNSKVFGSVIETITFHPRRRVDVPVGVTYDVTVDETRAVLERALQRNAFSRGARAQVTVPEAAGAGEARSRLYAADYDRRFRPGWEGGG